MFKQITLTTAALALVSAPALAGSPEPAPVEPVIAQATPVSTSPDWTGFYAGGELGYSNFDASPGGDEDEFIGGIVGGYDWDLGNWVVGVGADYDFAGGDVEQIFRAKGRAGYKIGQGLLYGTAGYAWADADNLGDDDGYVIGAGYEHLISSNFSLGGEVLYHEFDNFNSSGTDVDATTVQLRGTFRF